jgi:predicted SprT family Zn-dependent metalloprotease
MSELVTDKTIKAMYSLLRQMPPFNMWKLPPASKIKFKVVHDLKFMGEMHMKPYKMNIGLKHQEHFITILTTVAHEMIHLHLYLEGVKSYNQHRKVFRTKAHQVGTIFGLDRKTL